MTFPEPQWPLTEEVIYKSQRGVIIGVSRANRFSNETMYSVRTRDEVHNAPASKVRFLRERVKQDAEIVS